MRDSRLLFVSALFLAVTGCRPPPVPSQLEPSVIEFPATYTFFTHSIDVKFTLGGEPITGFELAVPDPETQKVFTASSYSPLGASPSVMFAPVIAREYDGQLQVTYEGREYSVALKGTARETPFCEVDDECLVATFDPTQEKCVVNNQAEGTPCGAFSCDGRSTCRSGTCVFEPTPNPVPLCVPDGPAQTLEPAWTYDAHFSNGELVFHGTTDRQGNLYFLDCSYSDFAHTCDAVSLTADGIDRWRALAVASFPKNSLYFSRPQIVVVGDRLIIGRAGEANQILALKKDDGGVVWTREFPVMAGLTRVNDDQIAVLSGAQAVLSVISLQDGEIVSRRSIGGGAPWGILSSGAGWFFGLIGDSPDTSSPPLSMSIFGGSFSGDLSWPMNVDSPQLTRLMAASGSHLVRNDGLVLRAADGKGLFHVPAVFNLFDVVLPDDEHAMAVTDTTASGCASIRLQQIDLTKETRSWECALATDRARVSFSVLHATADGGVVFTSRLNSRPTSIQVLHGDGTLAFAAQFPSDVMPTPNYDGSGLIHDSAPAVVGGRWITHAFSQTTPTRMIAAFDVAGLAPATKGWVGRGGNPRRDGSPELSAE